MGKEIGIDLGTTNTIVSYVNKKDKIVPLAYGKSNKVIIPSAVYFVNRNQYIIGSMALRKAKLKPEACITNFKSKLGEPRYKFNVTTENNETLAIKPERVASIFLKSIMYEMQDKIAREFANTDKNYIDKAVITVPAKFSPTEKETTKRAGLQSGLKDVSLMAEPTAGAIAYMEDFNIKDKTILVYDFGGGTFDISLLENKNGIFKCIYTDGDKNLGGNTLTSRIVQDIIDQINEDYGWELPYNLEDYDENYCTLDKNSFIQTYYNIVEIANRIKEELSEDNEANHEIPLLNGNDRNFFDCYYNREQLEQLIIKDINKTIEITNSTIDWANQSNITIDDIILIGGSSQIPIIEEKLTKMFPNINISVDGDVSTLISRGATIMANQQYSNDQISECTNAEIGVKSRIGSILDGFKMIIPDNQPLPYTASADFAITDTKATNMSIAIYERDIKRKPKNDTIRDNSVTKIDEVIIDNLPKNNSNDKMIVTITFTAQKDGSLELSADIKVNGQTISKNHTINKESNLL